MPHSVQGPRPKVQVQKRILVHPRTGGALVDSQSLLRHNPRGKTTSQVGLEMRSDTAAAAFVGTLVPSLLGLSAASTDPRTDRSTPTAKHPAVGRPLLAAPLLASGRHRPVQAGMAVVPGLDVLSLPPSVHF